MSRIISLAALALFALVAPAAAKGPPWISIESPANPLDPETRGAAFVVHVYHHAAPASFAVAGAAEGLVNGERRSIKLELKATSRPGVYVVERQWSTDGVWTVLVSIVSRNEKEATAIVEIGPQGEVASVRVPFRTEGRWTIPLGGDVLSRAELDRSLRARAALYARSS